MRTNNENSLYEQLAQYMNLKHPDVLYHFDLSGLWTPSHQARNLYGRLNKRAWPDLFIAEPKFPTDEQVKQSLITHDWRGTFSYGLFLELKKDGVALYKKDGSLRANPHHVEQAKVLESLRLAGYQAEFAVGFDNAIKVIEDYLR